MFRLMQLWGTYRGFAQREPVSSALKQKFYYPAQEPLPAESHPAGRRIDYSEIDAQLPSSERGAR